MNEGIETEMISRRRALSLLEVGRHWASRYRRRWSRWRPKPRRPPELRRRPLRPPEHTGCSGGRGGAPIGMNDAMAAMSGATSDERGRNRRGPRPPQPLQRNRGSICFRTRDRATRQTQNCISVRRTTQCARPQTEGRGGDGSPMFPQKPRESIL